MGNGLRFPALSWLPGAIPDQEVKCAAPGGEYVVLIVPACSGLDVVIAQPLNVSVIGLFALETNAWFRWLVSRKSTPVRRRQRLHSANAAEGDRIARSAIQPPFCMMAHSPVAGRIVFDVLPRYRLLEGSITANRKAESAWNLLTPVPMLAYCTLPVSAAINWMVLHGVLQVARLTLPVDMLSIAAMGICVPLGSAQVAKVS